MGRRACPTEMTRQFPDSPLWMLGSKGFQDLKCTTSARQRLCHDTLLHSYPEEEEHPSMDNHVSRHSCSHLTSVCTQPGVLPSGGSLLHLVWKGGIPVRIKLTEYHCACQQLTPNKVHTGKID